MLENADETPLRIPIAPYLGMRIDEICAHKWEDISFVGGIVSVRSSIQRLQVPEQSGGNKTKLVITTPKSADSVWEIPLPDFMLPIIMQLRDRPECYVLSSMSFPIEPRTLHSGYKSIIKRCGIASIKFHALRHTFATRCIECGFDVKTLNEILGHSTVRITLDRHVHTSIEQERANMKKLSNLSYLPSNL